MKDGQEVSIPMPKLRCAHHVLWGNVKLTHRVWEQCQYLYVHNTCCRAL